MEKFLCTLTLLLAYTFAQAQNDLKARVEFEAAEKAFQSEDYKTALKHLNEAEKLLGQWTPVTSYLKIESLYALTNMEYFAAPTMQPLYEEVTKYMAYLNKLKSDEVPMEKYKVVYSIEKILEPLKLEERQSPEFLQAKKEDEANNYDTAILIYEKLARKGNSWAMRNLGLNYEEKKDSVKAKEWYQKAIDNSNVQAALDLAGIDKENAREWNERAAQMGHPFGIYSLGWYAENKDKNSTKAMEYYRQAAELGSVAGLFAIGEKYYDDEDYIKAEEYYKKAAVKGSSNAMYQIGVLYNKGGNGIAKNHKTAMEWYLKAVEKGNTNAMNQIGWIYQNGQGDYAKDYKKAAEWYQKRIDNGDKAGFLNLGDLYSLPDNSQPQKALGYYEKVAEAEFLRGILETANLYFSGIGGITKDYAKAAKYYEKYYSFKKENESYIDNLIKMYNSGGNGIEKDKEKAKYWKEIRRK